ncbi:MAG: hypothetical protein JWQ21_2994 [Herminiimonas sp.]|nr:hypothetical protein [Herminiimonas sp.]
MPHHVSTTFRVLIVTAVLMFGLFADASAQQAEDGWLAFEIAAVPGIDRHLGLLEYPAYLAAALDNNGIKSNSTGKIILVDERNIRTQNAALGFSEKKGAVYFYKAVADFDVGVTRIKFQIPLVIDTSAVRQGRLTLRIQIPMAKIFPQALIDRIHRAVQVLTNEGSQKKMVNYFDGLANKRAPGSGMQGIFSQIMMQAYNTSVNDAGGVSVREPGDAESLYEQRYLLATLAIWIIIVPLAFLLFTLRRRWKRRKAGK